LAPLATGTPVVAAIPTARRLRVGVFADAPLQPRWLVEALARLAASDFADVILVEVGAARGGMTFGAPLAWGLYSALDRRVFSAGAGDAGEYIALQGLVQGSGSDLDVALALGNVDDRELYARARYGVWRFEADGTSEVVNGEAMSGSALVARFGEGRPARVAYQSWSRTYPFSVSRNRNQLLRKTGEFAWRALRELHRGGEAWLSDCKQMTHPSRPGAERGLRELARVASRVAGRAVDKALHIEQWSLAFAFGQELSADLAGFTRLLAPKDRDWADPFAIERNGRYYVFFEELPYATGKAHISMMEITRDGRTSRPQRVLERDYHLSYPFIFEHDGELYMLPETAANGTLELYRCVDFPLAWKLERVLMSDVRMVDATLHRERSGAQERWWMFANVAPQGSGMFDDELHLFHAPHPLGEWRPHPKNPVKSDARGARPAGALFTRQGTLYRPAQVCVPRYGAGIALQRVLKLSPNEYVERQAQRLLPPEDSGLAGLHTVNRAGDLVVVDAFMRRKRI
jgi:hypothetical protein